MTPSHDPHDVVVPPQAVPGQPGPPTAGPDADPLEAQTAVVPPQETRPRRDAFDLYAQIYALRTGSGADGLEASDGAGSADATAPAAD